jgi:hypothetical protein
MDLWSWTELYIGTTQFKFKHKPINDEKSVNITSDKNIEDFIRQYIGTSRVH